MIGSNTYNVTAEGPVKTDPTGNFLLRLIQNHYSIVPKIKSDAQLNREKWLVLNVLLFNRWFLLPAAFVIQFCCGSLYAWSVFNKPIDFLMYGPDTTSNVAPITFYVAIGCYGCAAGLAGPWLEKTGPANACLFGIMFVFIGNLITALGLHLRLMSLVFLGYGGFVGAGFGICYISPVSTLQKWFPDMRGLGAGFATCGFGAGTIALAKVQIPLLNQVGLSLTFVTLGSCFLVLMTLAAIVLRTPPNNYDPNASSGLELSVVENSDADNFKPGNVADKVGDNTEEVSLLDAMTSTDFRLMLIMFVGDIAFGIVLAARLANVIIDVFGKSPEEAATVVSVNGGVNFVGRLAFSILSDFLGRKYCYVIMLTSQVIVLGLFSTMTNGQMFVPFWIAISVATATYGAAFGVIPAFLTDKFGPTNIGACHGIFIAAWAGSGVLGGIVFTLLFNSLLASGYGLNDAILYNTNAWWLFGVACTGWIAIHFVKPTAQDLRLKSGFKKVFKVC